MRQAVTTIIAVSFLVISPAARANDQGLDAGATIAQARRLIDAKDYSPATELLEDLLPETNATDRQVILELLRQTYGAMAREAKAAGRDREAAHLLDNLAIIARMPGLGASTKPTAETPRKPAPPQRRRPIPRRKMPRLECCRPYPLATSPWLARLNKRRQRWRLRRRRLSPRPSPNR